jgi:hypothetical protein
MLAAWFRMAYPKVATGAIASSAPVRSFIDTPKLDKAGFYEVVTTDFHQAGCDQVMHDALRVVERLRYSHAGRRVVSRALHLCSPLDDAAAGASLQSFLHTGLQYMAMCDYPYPTSFLKPMPANPVRVACHRAQTTKSKKGGTRDEALLRALGAAVRVYYMSRKPQSTCLDQKKQRE